MKWHIVVFASKMFWFRSYNLFWLILLTFLFFVDLCRNSFILILILLYIFVSISFLLLFLFLSLFLLYFNLLFFLYFFLFFYLFLSFFHSTCIFYCYTIFILFLSLECDRDDQRFFLRAIGDELNICLPIFVILFISSYFKNIFFLSS